MGLWPDPAEMLLWVVKCSSNVIGPANQKPNTTEELWLRQTSLIDPRLPNTLAESDKKNLLIGLSIGFA